MKTLYMIRPLNGENAKAAQASMQLPLEETLLPGNPRLLKGTAWGLVFSFPIWILLYHLLLALLS
ncbi:MAG: hypothetical protein HUU32_20055 [Calditrichaceae bacterium]|nr:hypothetical protein [Calditrichia bacterium]NUQ43692.1 hypothetical protein [Calditrichaceae bacterium]